MENINTSSMLPVGVVLHGTYRIERYLSSGGFGNTYVVRHIHFDEEYAVKEFFMRGINQRDDQTSVSVSNAENRDIFVEQLEKFKKEAQRLRRLHNDHIVRVHDLFEENGTAYYVMDYIDGENLSERLKRTQSPMSEEEVSALLPQVLDALDTVHKAGMMHLDLKPGNIMVDRQGQAKLIDFGASKQQGGRGSTTMSTGISYTEGYAPREQMEQNRRKFGPWTDIYALGATLYNLLTNRHPPMPSDIDEDHTPDKHHALPFPSGVSAKMRNVVLRMMTTNRTDRPQCIADVCKMMNGETAPAKSADESTILSAKAQDEETFYAGKDMAQAPLLSRPVQSKVAERASFSPQPQLQQSVSQQQEESDESRSSLFSRYKIYVGLAAAVVAGLVLFFVLRLGKHTDTSTNVATVSATVENMTFAHELGECSYTGEVNSDDEPEGKGVATFYKANGEKDRVYDGEFSHGKFNGEGTFEWIGEQTFKGTFKDNYYEKGRLTMADGTYYEGTFRVVNRDGERTADVYNGTWYTPDGKADAEVVNGKEQ